MISLPTVSVKVSNHGPEANDPFLTNSQKVTKSLTLYQNRYVIHLASAQQMR